MKELMLGNKALARGLYEAGCSVASSYPGTPSTEVTEEIAKYRDIYSEWAPNEKVAMEVAYGAALAGKRSMCAMKHVGMNVAADPMYTASYTGVNAGMVIVVADDPGMHSSQNEQDSRHHALAAKLPMLEPSDSAEALAFAKAAYGISEAYDTPVIIKMCTRIAHSQSVVQTGERVCPEQKEYAKNPQKYLMTPANAIYRHPVVEERSRKLVELGNECVFEGVSLNRIEWAKDRVEEWPQETGTLSPEEEKIGRTGIICDSTCYQYVKEVFGGSVDVLKIGLVNPLPTTLILDFASRVEELWVVEELDPVIEHHCRKLGLEVRGKNLLPKESEYSQNLLREVMGMDVPTGGCSTPCTGRMSVLWVTSGAIPSGERRLCRRWTTICAWARPSACFTVSTKPAERSPRRIPSL